MGIRFRFGKCIALQLPTESPHISRHNRSRVAQNPISLGSQDDPKLLPKGMIGATLHSGGVRVPVFNFALLGK